MIIADFDGVHTSSSEYELKFRLGYWISDNALNSFLMVFTYTENIRDTKLFLYVFYYKYDI